MSKHVVFVVGEGEYESERTMPGLAKELQERHGLRCTLLIDQNVKSDAWKPTVGQRSSDIPNLETLAQADLAVFYLRFRTLPEEQLAHLQKYLDSGRPVAGFRTSTHSFNYNPDDTLAKWNKFGAEVLGAPWIKHYGHESSTDVTRVPEAFGHPILEGVEPSFHVRSWLYHVKPEYPPKDATPLLLGTSVGPGGEEPSKRVQNPVAWTRQTKAGGRVFFTTLGHPNDFEQAPVRTLALNGLRWALGVS
ncbi:MAG: ThuA domain-containing protein [Planctomycetota bacterium]|nr:ThuA domain-containing protein [Planctomycetota bacterium]